MSRFKKLSHTLWHCKLCAAEHNWQSHRTCDKLSQSCIGFSSIVPQKGLSQRKSLYYFRRIGRTYSGPPLEVVVFRTNNFSHGGGTVYNRGTEKIGLGTLGEYYGPCPSKSPHGYGNYEFTVLAYNSDDVVIGIGSHFKEFP